MSKSTTEIRQMFLNFFHSKGHHIVESSSLVPNNDSTLLFTNSGMVQFKNIFLNKENRKYKCAASSQRCVRAGGKHNDLKKVGYTPCHHTFFEMLGNFSFGDYFKKEAIIYAWELLTSERWFQLPKERLLITVYKNDNETFDIWSNDIGIPNERIIRVGDDQCGGIHESDNFWQMGDTGPCGPCTEIFYDYGHNLNEKLPDSLSLGKDENRYIEIWNIVFMQFNRQSDGRLHKLPKVSVDTGMGLERIAAVIQHVHSNYKIDLFTKLIKSVAYVTGTTEFNNPSLCVIADHIRSCAFLISDGVIPSNENRGYVLRRIIRRALRHGNMLGVKEAFFYKLVKPLIKVMDTACEDLKLQQIHVENVLQNEEVKFAKTLERGINLLNEKLINRKIDTLDGETIFRLYDTFGFPIELTSEICHEHNVKIDEIGFEMAMNKQRQMAREASRFGIDYSQVICLNSVSKFKGYEHLALDAIVKAIFVDIQQVNMIIEEQEAIVFLDKTPFYGESGGQVGDTGVLIGENIEFEVTDTRNYGKSIGHIGKIKRGKLNVGDYIHAKVNEDRRLQICCNHSATHLLHGALRLIFGNHIIQKGSLVNDKCLRFDFFHFESIKEREILDLENLVNHQIRRNLLIETKIMELEIAKKEKAIGFFDKKYEQFVRVQKIGDFSIELCGGTHITHTGNIGLFCIQSVSSIARDVRRIEAVTGEQALLYVHIKRKQLYKIANLVKSDINNVDDKINNLVYRLHMLEKDLQKLRNHQVFQECSLLTNQAIEIKGTKLLVSKLNNIEPKMLRTMIDILKNRLGSAIIVLATISEGKVVLISGVTLDLIHQIKANDLIRELSSQIGAKGGGRADIAQAGGNNQDSLNHALSTVYNWVINKL